MQDSNQRSTTTPLEMTRPSTDNAEKHIGSSTADPVVDGSLELPHSDISVQKRKEIHSEEMEYITGRKLFTVVAAITLSAFIVMLDTAIISTAIPKITNDFHSLSDVGWYGSSYLISNCALQPTAGKLYNLFDSKWLFLSFLGVFELGSLLCGVSVSSDMLIIGRSIAGLGASGMVNGCLTIISACVPLHKRALYIGILMSFSQIGVLLGPVLGGALTTYSSWRWCFYINLPIGGFAAAVLFFVHIPQTFLTNAEPRTTKSVLQSLDLVGFGLFVPMAVAFLLALEWGGTTYSWNNARIIALFCLSGVLLIIFLTWERHRGARAMIPLSILSQRVVYSSCLATFALFSGMLISSYYLPIYFQAVLGVTASRSGVYTLSGILPQMLFSTLSGYLVGRLGYYLPWIIALGVMTSIGYGLLTTLGPDTTTAEWVVYQILGGIGRGCGLQMPIVAVQNALPPQLIPIGMSLIVFSQNLGGAISLAIVETVFSKVFVSSLHKIDPSISSETVANAGASGFRSVVAGDQLNAVIRAYSDGIDAVFYVAMGLALATLCAASGMGWKSVKAKMTTSDS